MSRTRVAIGLLITSLVLLVIYGADVLVASSTPTTSGSSGKTGFLPLSESARGAGFGGAAVVMSIIAFVIARLEPSTTVSILLFVNGGIILAGMIALIGQGALSHQSTPSVYGTIGSTMALGAVLVGLGVWKSLGDRHLVAKKQHA